MRQPVGDVVLVGDRAVDPRAVVRRSPLEAALVAARADERVPDEVARLRVEHDVDAALLAEADDVALLPLAELQLEDVRRRAAEIPLLAVRLCAAPRHRRGLRAACALPRL